MERGQVCGVDLGLSKASGHPFACGDKKRGLLTYLRGRSDLIHRQVEFFFHVTIDLPDAEEASVMAQSPAFTVPLQRLLDDLGITSVSGLRRCNEPATEQLPDAGSRRPALPSAEC